MPEVKPAGARGDPNFAVWRLSIDNNFAAICKLDLENAIGSLKLQVKIASFECTLDLQKYGVDQRVKFAFVHRVIPSIVIVRIAAMPRPSSFVAILSLVCCGLTCLSGCGQKGPLKPADTALQAMPRASTFSPHTDIPQQPK